MIRANVCDAAELAAKESGSGFFRSGAWLIDLQIDFQIYERLRNVYCNG